MILGMRSPKEKDRDNPVFFCLHKLARFSYLVMETPRYAHRANRVHLLLLGMNIAQNPTISLPVTIQTGYQIADIPTLEALTSSQRTDGYARYVESDSVGNPSWYMFKASSTATADGNLVVIPNDNPSTGRWIKTGGSSASNFSEFGGGNLCTSGQCAIGGKAFQFYAPQTNLPLLIIPSFDIAIATGTDSIQLHRWSQQPNTALTGRTFAGAIANTGGTINVTIDSTYRWISFFARNPSNGNNAFDGVCFTMNGNVVTLLGYS